MGQSVVLPKPAATGMGGMAAMGGMPASLQARSPDANRLARLQAILTRSLENMRYVLGVGSLSNMWTACFTILMWGNNRPTASSCIS